MKYLLILATVLQVACATQPQPKGYELPPALSALFRGGQLRGLSDTQGQGAILGNPQQISTQAMTCTATPIFGLDGEFNYTDVRCF